ncbi:hypothetical protein ABH925_007452 [Streptacidiphilus sp. EB129]
MRPTGQLRVERGDVLRQPSLDLPGQVVDEDLVGAGLDAVEPESRDVLGADLGCVDAGGHVGVDVADVQPRDGDAARLQVEAQGVALGPHGGLGGAVGVGEADPREHGVDGEDVTAARTASRPLLPTAAECAPDGSMAVLYSPASVDQ